MSRAKLNGAASFDPSIRTWALRLPVSHLGFQLRALRPPAAATRARRVEGSQPGVGNGKAALAGDVAFQAVGKRAQDHELLRGPGALQRDPLRHHAER